DHCPEPERRDREEADRYAPPYVIPDRVLPDRRENADGQRDDQRDQQRKERELDRGREGVSQPRRDRTAVTQRQAQVQRQPAAAPAEVLPERRLVQTQVALDAAPVFAADLVVTRDLLDDVARYQSQQEKHEQRHADQRRHREEQALDDVLLHIRPATA